jgi:hypothetical protein
LEETTGYITHTDKAVARLIGTGVDSLTFGFCLVILSPPVPIDF